MVKYMPNIRLVPTIVAGTLGALMGCLAGCSEYATNRVTDAAGEAWPDIRIEPATVDFGPKDRAQTPSRSAPAGPRSDR